MRRVRFGFTLIEILIVIAVFSIWVLSILKMITYNIGAEDTIRLKTTASFLAKESMSLVFNTRDSNRLAWLERDCIPNLQYNGTDKLDVCSDSLISGHQLDHTAWMFDISPTHFVDIQKISLSSDFASNFEHARLFLSSWAQTFPVSYYSTWDWWVPTYYARYVVFTWLIESGVVLPRDQLVKVESHVLYQKWSMTGEFVLESFIWNY